LPLGPRVVPDPRIVTALRCGAKVAKLDAVFCSDERSLHPFIVVHLREPVSDH